MEPKGVRLTPLEWRLKIWPPSSASRCFIEVESEERATYISLAAMFMLPLSTILINCSNCSIFTGFPDFLV